MKRIINKLATNTLRTNLTFLLVSILVIGIVVNNIQTNPNEAILVGVLFILYIVSTLFPSTKELIMSLFLFILQLLIGSILSWAVAYQTGIHFAHIILPVLLAYGFGIGTYSAIREMNHLSKVAIKTHILCNLIFTITLTTFIFLIKVYTPIVYTIFTIICLIITVILHHTLTRA